MHFFDVLSIALVAFLPIASASCAHGTGLHVRHLNEHRARVLARRAAEGAMISEESGAEILSLPNFDYGTVRGPLQWQNIDPANALCSTGTKQSPIVLDGTIPQLAPGTIRMEVANPPTTKFENLGTTVEVAMEGKTTVGNATFNLKQFHFHTPSEHRINGEHFPIEVHMVHEATNNPEQIAVVAVLVQLSGSVAAQPTLQKVIKSVSLIPSAGAITQIEGLDMQPLIAAVNGMSFFSYEGSLTTPPCAEGLIFNVGTQPVPLDVDSFNLLKAVVKGNNRHVQNVAGQQNLLILSPEAVRPAPVGVAEAKPAENVAPEAVARPAEEAKPAESAVAEPATAAAPGTEGERTIIAPPPAAAAPVAAEAGASSPEPGATAVPPPPPPAMHKRNLDMYRHFKA